MSDFLATLLIMIATGLLFLIPAAYFGGKIGVSITAITLTAISCYLFVYAIALGKSFSNSNSSISLNMDMLLQFLTFTAFYAFMAYGSFCFSQVAHGLEGYKIKLLIWAVLLTGYPMYLSISSAYNLHNRHRKHYSSNIIITHAKDFPILIDRIKFFDSKTKKASSIYSRYHENYRKVSEIEGLTDQYEFMQSQRYYTNLTHTLIPIDFDSFELSWYSVLENKFYKDIFPIDQKKLKVDETYEKQLTISNMLIHILPNGHVDLLKKEYTDYTHLTPYFDVAFNSVEGQTLTSIFKTYSQTAPLDINSIENLKRDFKILKKGTVTKLSPEEILSFRSVYPFGIDIEINKKPNEINELKEIKIIDFYLNQYSRRANFLREINTKPLPSFIKIKILNNKDERRWVAIMFDKKLLFNQYTTFIETPTEEVSFDIKVNIEDLTKSKIWLKSKDKKIALDNWIITDQF
ncbi:MAG: hypothetical protein COB81_07605 [Flavobacteriaceae bacterium]|nr:MAG: hypothetical protein COB81_07605 [Flavobacteriaceae bacterium]